MESKKEIRQRVYQARKQMLELEWQEKSERIAQAVVSHPWFEASEYLYVYIDCRHEVGTRGIIEEAWRKGKNVLVPKVIGEEMCFLKIDGFDELKPGAYGILEPESKPGIYGILESGLKYSDQLIIVPGVAFDVHCTRIGYGGGYYDRYLAAHPQKHTMAVAFEYQIFPELPKEPHDIYPELVITEKQMIYVDEKPIK